MITEFNFGNHHPGYKRFRKDLQSLARKHEVKLTFPNRCRITSSENGSESSGYFDSEDLELAVARKTDFETFISILAHESCHFDQWLEDKYLWDKCSPGYNLFFQWLEDKKIVKRELLEESVQDIIRLELDCEKRTLRKIKKYNLPIDEEDYIKKSNCYLYGYLFFLEKKIWIPAVYTDERVHAVASKRYAKSYTKIPTRLRRAFEKKLREIKKTR